MHQKVKKTILFIFVLVLSHSAFSQVIWSENFDSYADGTAIGANNNTANPANDWTSGGCLTCPSSATDWWDVQAGVMEARDVNDEHVFLQTEVIDISASPSVDFFVDVTEQGDLEGLYLGVDDCAQSANQDYADVEYRIDSGPWILVSNYLGWCGLYASCGTHTFYGDDGGSGDCRTTDTDWVAAIVQVTGLTGNTLELRFSATNSSGSEYIRFDNIEVIGCEAPVGTVVSGDEICDAEDLGTIPPTGSVFTASDQTNVCATDINDPEPNAWTSEQGVWFQFTAPASGHVRIDALGNISDPIDLQLAIYGSDDNSCTGTITELASSYDASNFDESMPIGCLTGGSPYWVFIDGEVLTDGAGSFDVIISDAGVYAVSNDQICMATPLGEPVSPTAISLSAQNNYCATNTLDPSPTWGNEMGVWYSFIAPSSGIVEIDLTSSVTNEIDLQVAIFDSDDMSCTGNMTEISSSYSQTEPLSNPLDENLIVPCLTASRTYYILVDGEGAGISADLLTGLFDIAIAENPEMIGFLRN